MEHVVIQQRENFKREKEELEKIELIDINGLKQDIAKIDEKNAMIRDNKRYDEEKGKLDDLRDVYGKLDVDLASIRQERINSLQSANIPVEGLTFSEDGLLYDDLPFSQCSDGKKLMIAMRIKMSQNPNLKVVMVKDGSLIGPKNLKALKQIVKENGFRLFIESVCGREQYENNGRVGIYIEEGVIVDDGVDEKESQEESQEQSSELSEGLKEEVEEMNVSNDNNNKNEINDEDDDW